MTATAKHIGITALYDGTEMIVHKARCEHRTGEMTYPEIHETLHLSGSSRAAITGRIWRDSLYTDKHREAFATYARRTRFQSCTAELGA